MKTILFAKVVISGLAVAILGVAAPAQAAATGDAPPLLHTLPEMKIGVDHLDWLDDIRQKVDVPKVDTSVRQSR